MDSKEIKIVKPKENQPWTFMEGLMLKLKLQYFGLLLQRADSLEKILMLERLKAKREGSSREWDCWIASLTQWTWIWANPRRRWRTGKPGMLYVAHGAAKNQTQLSEWTTTNYEYTILCKLFPFSHYEKSLSGEIHICYVDKTLWENKPTLKVQTIFIKNTKV